MQEINIGHIIDGQKSEFKILFDQYFNALCSFAYNFVPDVPTIEDYVQEAFISFWEKKSNFDQLNTIKS